MTVAEYVVDRLIERGVTDAFGIPGGVILDFIYALDARVPVINAHLNFHEQAAGFAACGNAQSGNRISVAYGTRGPGISNMFTCIAEAYYESIPVVFITAHAGTKNRGLLRCADEQEMDITENVKSVTKYAVRIDSVDSLASELTNALNIADSGRKGPVLLDIYSGLWNKEISLSAEEASFPADDFSFESGTLINKLKECERPIFLLGDGIKQSNAEEKVRRLIEKYEIPAVSSRGSQDISGGSDYYYGYVGSHGIRYANLIFEQADFVIALGNRMAFPAESESYRKALSNKTVIRFDIDEAELSRDIVNTSGVCCDLNTVIDGLLLSSLDKRFDKWIEFCKNCRSVLFDADINKNVSATENVLRGISTDSIIVADVGNNEFWLSRAYEHIGLSSRVYYSKSFGTLGLSIGKSIGVHYATGKPVACIVGDQGIQLNVQELMTISQNRLPITVFVLNNAASAMIKDREMIRYNRALHTTEDTGYGTPDFKKLAEAYGITYIEADNNSLVQYDASKPNIVEVRLSADIPIEPNLPKGAMISNMAPCVSKDVNEKIQVLLEEIS